MKNSIFYRLTGAIAVLLCTCVLSASAYSPGRTHTDQKQGSTFNQAATPNLGYAANIDINVMNVCDAQPALNEPKFSYLVPVNDPKPDNTLVQVWRSESLKLHTANMRFC